MADGSLCQTDAAGEQRCFYVYLISRHDGTPCYVGKGKGNRWRLHAKKSHNKHLAQSYESAGGELPIRKIVDFVSELEAFELEKFLIAEIGRDRKSVV